MLDANNKIGIEIGKQFINQGHDCIVCGMSKTKKNINLNQELSFLNYFVPTDIWKQVDEQEKGVLLQEKHFQEYGAYVEQLVKKYKPNTIICVQMPFQTMQSVFMNTDINCNKYLLQLDPWGLHEFREIDQKDAAQRMREELMIFEKAKHIFTTPILKKCYAINEKYNKFINKITGIEFPNIKDVLESGISPIDFDDDYINIIHAGLIDDEYRNPDCFLKIVAELLDKQHNLRVYFLGICKSKTVEYFGQKYPSNILVIPPVNANAAIWAMKKADLLLSIGNTIANQMPSKIYDYISIGKPIIHLQKIKECLAISKLKKYPECYIIDETSLDDCSDLLYFINKAKGRHIPFVKINKIYYDATPEYVAKRILAKIVV